MNRSGHEKPDFDVWGQKAPPKQQSGGRKRHQNVKVAAKSAPAIRTRQNPNESQYKSGGRKRPQCTSQQKVDTTLYFYTSFNEHNTPYTVLESDNSESMPDVLH